jgi:hypothetical protein
MRVVGVLVLLTALAVSGCTKADSPTVTAPAPANSSAGTDSSAAGFSDSPTVPSASTSDLLSPSGTPSLSTSPSVSASKTSPAPTTAAPVVAGCAASALSISVDRGSGVAGHQYATVVFKNTSTAACPLAGFPGVQLLVGGKAIGSSVRSGTAKTITLAPGASAQSQLVNDSTCGAAESDSVQIIAPNTSTPVVLPLVFRGCTVTVSPVQAA